MNNIEILEEFRKSIKNFNNYADNTNVSLINKKQVKAIENLIQENKELKEHLQKYYNGELFTAKQLKSIEENQRKYFIHKSKVKEKIEELNKEMLKEENSLEIFYRKKYCTEFLQELLEKGE